MMDFLLLLSIIGIITSTMYALLVATGAVRLAQRRRSMPLGTFAPPVSLLKPLHGLEPDLESHLQSFFEQDYPEFEIIFCARTDQDAGLQIARRVAARYPKIRSRFLCSGNAPYANAKVWSLERMQNAASHRFFVVSDSDVSVTPDYLRAVMAPFADERVGLVTCLYRGVGSNIWSRLEAVGMSIEMSAGVLVAEMLEGMKFALGPTMVVRRDSLEAAGGFRALGPYHADDFMLGNMIAAGGHRVVLSTHTIDHHVLNSSFLSFGAAPDSLDEKHPLFSPQGTPRHCTHFQHALWLAGGRHCDGAASTPAGRVAAALELGFPGGAGRHRRSSGGRGAKGLAKRAALSSARPAGVLLLGCQLREQPGAVAGRSLQPAAGRVHEK